MAVHMSIRLAWHDSGWNGHICKKPSGNSYCVGQYSYPGNLIASTRDLDFEKAHAGEACKNFPCKAACSLSVNAFGNDEISTKIEPPGFWPAGYALSTTITLPPHTACTWCYEKMYSDEVKITGNSKKQYDYDKRREVAENFFKQFEPEKSLIFYYAGYSNPFSENEENNYVIVGISRVKKISPILFYDNASYQAKQKYGGAFIWQMPVTSNYPDEGFCIPYQKYMDDEEKLNRLVVKPSNRAPFKYDCREVTNDDAIEVINQLIAVVDALIEFEDTTEDWQARKNWLNSVLAELWKARGAYPGFPAVLEYLNLNDLISAYINLTNDNDRKNYKNSVQDFLNGTNNSIANNFLTSEINKIRRNAQLLGKDKLNFLFNVLSRFALSAAQVKALTDDSRGNFSVTASVAEMIDNPYIIFEQYNSGDSDNTIPLYKIDNGVIPSPDYGINSLLDVDSAERFRAFCVDELKKNTVHSFVKAVTVLNAVNLRLDRFPAWKKATFIEQNFNVDKAILASAITQRTDSQNCLYLYLKESYEDERTIETALSSLVNRPDIQPNLIISKNNFKQSLRVPASPLITACPNEYDEILDNQADICMKIFTKPLCIISGNAGTGKTTVIKAILDNITRVHGIGTSFLLMAPTGKATERIKIQTDKKASTIHSHLAQNGWLNGNFTFKRVGGKQGTDFNTIIIDECSMIDLNLFATLIRAINWNSVQRLILIGDPNQLPPIGRGKVFVEIIEWLKNSYPDNVGILKDNVRQLVNKVQNNGCGILDLANIFIHKDQNFGNSTELKANAEKIFEKILMNGNGDVDKDLGVYFWKTQDELENYLLAAITQDLNASSADVVKLWKEIMNDNPEKIQVISPYRGEFYGTGSINLFMQKTFNNYWSKKLLDGIGYYDKVIQIRNRPQSDLAYAYSYDSKSTEPVEIFNGEIGRVIPHGLDLKNNQYKWANIEKFQVIFSGKTRQGFRYNYGKNLGYCNGNIIPNQDVQENLELAYAISVHKAQGSEFEYVYIVLPNRESRLLSTELLYTAITRAQKKVTVFLQEDIHTLTSMRNVEKSAINKINSSVFDFNPLPDEIFSINSTWYESSKTITTLSKYLVRSKSEAIIANLLADRDIPFEYETPLFSADGTMFLPDFTVTFKGEKFYWEHVGLINDSYNKHWKKKEAWYNKHFPGKLLVTYESTNLTKDAEEIIKTHI